MISFVTMIIDTDYPDNGIYIWNCALSDRSIEHTYGITGEEYKDFANPSECWEILPENPAVYYKRMYRSSPDSGIYSDDHDGVDLWKYHQSDSQVAGSSAERRRRQSEF